MADTPRSIELTGKTVDDAVQHALRSLGLARTQVRVTVLHEGRPGVFGIGSSHARVRVEALPGTRPAPPTPERAPLPRIDDYTRYQESDSRAPSGRSPLPPRGSERLPQGGGEGRSGSGGGRGGGRGRGGGGGRGTRGGRERESAFPPDGASLPFTLLAAPGTDPGPDPVEHAQHVLTDLLHLLGINADVTARAPETPMDGKDHAAAVLDVNPEHPDDDLSTLIGRRGEHLAALQYLVNLIVSRHFRESHPVTVDVHGYKRRREEALNALAVRLADRVRETRAPVTLEPMPAAERRIIHLVLQEDPDVATESVGEGDARKVTIVYRD